MEIRLTKERDRKMADHKCCNKDRIKRNEDSIDRFNQIMQDIGELKGFVTQIPQQYKDLNKRINGTFEAIGEHMKEAPEYRERIATVESEVKTINSSRKQNIKTSQWKTGLIIGGILSIPSLVRVVIILLAYLKGQ